jgi:hypothetical protein
VNQKRTGKNASLKRKYHKILYDWFRWVILYVLEEKVSQEDIPVLSFRISVADTNPCHENPGPAFCVKADPDPDMDRYLAFYATMSKFT